MGKIPRIYKNMLTGEMEAGFINPDTNEFEKERDLYSEKDVDKFMDDFNLCVVMISKMPETD